MNRKEVLEIKKLFTMTNCCITRICGCYVSSEKEKKASFKESFLSLPEEVAFKYLEIFKKTLSGASGKNLLSFTYSLDEEKAGMPHSRLMDLRNSKLQDEELLDQFYDNIIACYESTESYLILLIHGVYDIPGKTSDGFTMEDTSESVYEYLLCSICPMDLSEPGLFYNAEKMSIEQRIRDRIVKMPVDGFLFPSFTDRQSDIHEVLVYRKNKKIKQDGFLSSLIGCDPKLSSEEQRALFSDNLREIFNENTGFKKSLQVYNGLLEKAEQSMDENPKITVQECCNILLDQGVEKEKIDIFENSIEKSIGKNESIPIANICDLKKTVIETGDVKITVPAENLLQIETMEINGRKCLVIPSDVIIKMNDIQTHI